MLVIPEKPVDLLWCSTVVDIGPGTRYGHRSDGASINTDLCIRNSGTEDISVPLSLLTSDPDEHRAPAPQLRIKKEIRLPEAVEMKAQKLEDAVAALAQQQGQDPEAARNFIKAALAKAARGRRHKTFVTVKAGQKLYLRLYQRERIFPVEGQEWPFKLEMLVPAPALMLVQGGTAHVAVLLPRSVDGFTVTRGPYTTGFNAQEATLNERQVVSWRWGNDPILVIEYRYT